MKDPGLSKVQELIRLAKPLNNNCDTVSDSIITPTVCIDDISSIDYHGLTALFCEHKPAFENTISKELQNELRARKPLLVANEALRHRELGILFDAFMSADLHDFVIFKGGALAYTVYAKAWQRPRTDTDILINRSELNEFSRVFEGLGYSKLFAISGDYVSYQCTFGKHLVGSATINIDVHWRINNRQCLARSFSLIELQQTGQMLNSFTAKPLMPSYVDCLLISCLHRLGHHHREERLAWLYDIHLLCDSLNPDDWEILVQKASDKGLIGITLDGLRCSRLYFSTNIPNHVSRTFEKSQTDLEASSIYIEKDTPEWRLFLLDVHSIEGFQGKWRFIIETMFPAPSYVKKQMNTDSALLAYLIRAKRGLTRFFKS